MRAPVVALLAAWAAALAAAQTTQTLGPLCLDLANSVGISPQVAAGFVSQLPTPPSNGICPAAINNQSTPTTGCEIVSILGFGLTQGTGNATCNPAGEAQIMPSGTLKPLRDVRPLPMEFDPATEQSLLQTEGATYAWLFHAARNSLIYAPCANSSNASLVLPAGWAVVATDNITQLPSGQQLPYLFVAVNNQTGQLLAIFRPTGSSYEWTLDFEYNQTSSQSVLDTFGSPMHFGFSYIFEQIWPTLQAALDEYVVNGAVDEVYFTGHSLGGSIGSMASLAAQEYLNEEMGTQAPTINSVLFAAANAGTSNFTDAFDELVNARRIVFSEDIVSQLPCPSSMPACAAAAPGLLGTVGVRGIPTDQGNATSWPYSQIGATIQFDASQMPQDQSTWAQINQLPICYAFNFLAATHGCSFYCFLSQYEATPQSDTHCWLSTQPAGAPGSQCMGFPVPGYLSPAANSTAAAPALAPATSAPATSTAAQAPAVATTSAPAMTSAAPRAASSANVTALLLALLAMVLVVV